MIHRTVIDLNVCQSLPLIHRYHPPAASPSTTQINDELLCIILERFKDRLQAIMRETSIKEEIRGNNDLLKATVSLIIRPTPKL